ncbi:MAG: RNA-dependent RNA polymerase [Taraxacum cytorhabdovirus 1]|uniref:Replicase n=1 Tax=Taraxacum cytorhabdovirus 1 TaxID=2950880 RepID=A0AAE9MRU6_9RHAB|nr:MAG: RNA-dependent RNA polymerase [Taraxacum cytorhabdovirus 1]
MDYCDDIADDLDDLYDNEEEHSTKQTYDSLPDYHLRNPLKDIKNEYQSFLSNESGISWRKRKSLHELKQHASNIECGNQIDLLINAASYFMISTDLSDMSNIAAMVLHRLSLDKPFARYMDLPALTNAFDDAMAVVDQLNLLLSRNLQQVVIIMNALSSRRPVPDKYSGNVQGGGVILNSGDYRVTITGSYIGVSYESSLGKERTLIYESDWIRGVADVYTQRFLLNISCTIGNKLNSYHYPTWDYVEQIIGWGDNVLLENGNNGFKLLKTYEALCAGYLMTMSDDLISDRFKFYNNTRYDLIEENPSWRKNLDQLDSLLHGAETVHWVSQVYGLHRIWGHPIIDCRKGMEKVITIGRKNIIRSTQLPDVIAGHFRMMLARGFRSKYKRLPVSNLSGVNDDFKLLIENNDPQCVDGKNPQIFNWADVKFEKNFQLPETFNLSMIVADKSVSPTRSELIKNIKKRKTVMNAELRRGVLRWINDSTIDPRMFLREVNDGLFPRDQMIIGLTPKERELNPTPRMFSLMSHQMRVYVVITEAMLSEHILPLFPQITMTDSLLDLSKKIYSNVKDLQHNSTSFKSKARRTVCFSLDFEKWNGHMRKESTGPMFTALGELFGLPNLYSNTYDIFESSYYYLADGSYIPRHAGGELIVEEPYSFTGHKGGMEGLRQKGWTLFTVVCLDYILSRHNCQYQIMGMGDNQVLVVTFYTHFVDLSGSISPRGITDLKNKMERLTSDLISTFGDLGLPLKPLETWTSESLFIYGKYPVWKGVPLSMDLKRLMRSFPFSNDDIMTIENILNTVAGGVTSAAQSCPFLGVSYIIGILMLNYAVYDLYRYHPLTGKGIGEMINTRFRMKTNGWTLQLKGHRQEYKIEKSSLDKDILMMMMIIVPRSLGGYVTFNWPTLLMRGFPDPLTRDLYVVKSMVNAHKNEGNGYVESLSNWSKLIYMPERNIKLLLEDILSLNTMRPVTPLAEVRQSVARFLSKSKKIKNGEFQDLMQIKNGEVEDILAETLCAGHVLHIRLIHDIYESTIIGYVDSIVSKVTKTATIQRLSMMESKKDVSLSLIACEDNYVMFYLWRSHHYGEEWSNECETEEAKRMRENSWGKVLKGITVPYPLSYMSLNTCYTGPGIPCTCNSSEGYISNHISDNAADPKIWELELGDGQPYMGSITAEKVTVQTGSKVYSSEPLVKRPVKLLRTINWFVPSDSNCAEIIKACLYSVTNVCPDQFTGISEGTSGAEAHRYRDSSLSHGTLTTCNYLYSSRMHISTDNLLKYSRGGKNCDIHFQAIMCAITEITNIYIATSNRRGEGMCRANHWHEICSRCITEIDEDFVDVPTRDASSFIPSRKTNKYLYVEGARISYIEDIRPYHNVIHGYAADGVYDRLSSVYKLNLLTDIVSDFITEQITQRSYDIQDVSTVSLHSGKMLNRLIYTKVKAESLFLTVASKIYLIAEFRMCKKFSEGDRYREEKVREMAMDYVSGANLGSFLGLGLYYSWGPIKSMERFSWFISPSTTPPTLSDACSSMQRSLLAFLRAERVNHRRITEHQIEDSKDCGLGYKLIMYNKLSGIPGSCEKCQLELASTPHHEYTKPNLVITCDQGHNILERYKLKVQIIRCTVDRLRKECESSTGTDLWVHKSRLPRLRYHSTEEIFSSLKMRPRFVNVDETYMASINQKSIVLPESCFKYKQEDIMKVISLPTSACYKYYDLLSYYKNIFPKGKKTWILGDGVGSTSEMYYRVVGWPAVTSTLIDSERVIPQTMPNLYESWDETQATDKISMVNKVNNIFHERWDEDWRDVYVECSSFISDIEILGPERWNDRNICLKRLMETQRWEFAISKDYIYTRRELESRISLLLKYTTKFQLITSPLRQKGHPEVWWVMRETSGHKYLDGMKSYIIYPEPVMKDIWIAYCSKMAGSRPLPDPTISLINENLVTKKEYLRMLNRAFSWSYFQSVGYLLPLESDFTHVLGRLQQGVRPIDVAYAHSGSTLKLYKDKEKELRAKLLTIAVSMLSTVSERFRLFADSGNWSLGWESKLSSKNWMPYLYRKNSGVPQSALNPDFIAVLSIYFSKRKMFSTYGNRISFAYTRKKNQKLAFPVAKNMILRLPSSSKDTDSTDKGPVTEPQTLDYDEIYEDFRVTTPPFPPPGNKTSDDR